MDIIIPDSWLKEYLKTKETPKKIMEYLSLCGPSVEKVETYKNESLYSIEITTNRVDSASIYGIAREATAILPRFGKKASLKAVRKTPLPKAPQLDIKIKNNPKLIKRILAIKIENVKVAPSPAYIQKRLELVGQRPINNLIDVTNYVMWELGHPLHVFDYDKLKEKTIIVREADKGEAFVTLDGKSYKALGGEVIFDNGEGEIIDLPGIIGTKNSAVDENTKNIVVWIESVDPKKIRKASMGQAIRTQAATLNEKGVDSELGIIAINRAVDLYQRKDIAGGKVASSLFDLNEKPAKKTSLSLTQGFINKKLGIELPRGDIKNFLLPLGFKATWKADKLTVEVPSFRQDDISIPEDVIEEIARIYGYHNLPSKLMEGALPKNQGEGAFTLESKIKNLLAGWGGIETYTYSMVSKKMAGEGALKLANPLGKETAYLRTNLLESLLKVASENSGEKDPFHLFEMANVYKPRKGDLPQEVLTLAGFFSNYSYREAKGLIEAMLEKLNIKGEFKMEDQKNFKTSQRLLIKASPSILGEFGVLENGLIFYQLEMEGLAKAYRKTASYKEIPKYPPQIEDITFKLPPKTKVADVFEAIKGKDKRIRKIKLLDDSYKDKISFRLWYQDKTKTLDNTDVLKIREVIKSELKRSFGIILD